MQTNMSLQHDSTFKVYNIMEHAISVCAERSCAVSRWEGGSSKTPKNRSSAINKHEAHIPAVFVVLISSYLQRDVSGVTVKNVEILLQPENRLKIQKSVLQHSLKSCFKHQCVQDFNRVCVPAIC